MPPHNITKTEHFDFQDLASLKVWIDQFKETDLATIYMRDRFGNDYITFNYETEMLSDGSEVNNIRIA